VILDNLGVHAGGATFPIGFVQVDKFARQLSESCFPSERRRRGVATRDKLRENLPGIGFGERPIVFKRESRLFGKRAIDDLLDALDSFAPIGLASVDSPAGPVAAARQLPALGHALAKFTALRLGPGQVKADSFQIEC
jgi:hypothetical protein